QLRERMTTAFLHLAAGRFAEAQAAASDSQCRPSVSGARPAAAGATGLAEGLLLANDFRLERKLASGGMGAVFLATQLSLNRQVVVKCTNQEHDPDSEI